MGLTGAPGFSQTAPGSGKQDIPSAQDRAPGAAGQSEQQPRATDTKKGADMSSAQIKQVQDALQAKGHNPGTSGVMDDKTREAIRAFQKAEGLAVTGTVDERTAKALGVSVSGARSGSGAGSGGTGSGAGGLGGSKGSSERPATPGSPGGSGLK